MSVSNPSIIETRRDQILPLLDATDIERAWRFGEVRRFATGEALAAIGEVGVGLGIILSGQVDVYRYDASGTRTTFSAAGSMRSNARPAGEAFAGVRLQVGLYGLAAANINRRGCGCA